MTLPPWLRYRRQPRSAGHGPSRRPAAKRGWAVGLAAVLTLAAPARAQFTWTNPAGGDWSAGANWGGTGPAAGGGAATTLTFGAAGVSGATYTANDDLPGTFNLNALTFTGTAPAGV